MFVLSAFICVHLRLITEFGLKNTALFVLSVWVNAPITAEDYSITEDMRIKNQTMLAKIKDAFLIALNDKDADARSSAVFGLSAFPEDKVIKALEEVAKSDPYYPNYEKGYPLRNEAKKSIDKIKAKMRK
jgi:hypothetical protein